MTSIDRAKTRQRGIRMALQVAALSGAAAAGVMALASSDARAEPASSTSAKSDGHANEEVGPIDALRVHGLSGFSCISRGPAAPPVVPLDFEILLARVPS